MIIFVADGWSHMNASYVSAAEKKNGSVDYRCTTSIVRAFLSEKNSNHIWGDTSSMLFSTLLSIQTDEKQ